jgi:hypothetical protein
MSAIVCNANLLLATWRQFVEIDLSTAFYLYFIKLE